MTFLQDLLSFVGLGGRLHLEWISSAEAQKFVDVVTDFTEKIRNLGPTPLGKLRGIEHITNALETDNEKARAVQGG